VSPVKYRLGFYIPEDDILHSYRRENLKSYIALTVWTLLWRYYVSPVKYRLGFYIPQDDILHSHRRDNLKSYIDCKQVYNCCLLRTCQNIFRHLLFLLMELPL
jgi:hypothetical protein